MHGAHRGDYYVCDGASESCTIERAAVNDAFCPLRLLLPFQPATVSLVGCRKRWGRGALGDAVGAICICIQATNRFGKAHIARAHLISPESDYAPPVISVPNMEAVTVQLLQKIRTANKICYAVRICIGLTTCAGKIRENQSGFCDADPAGGAAASDAEARKKV